MMKTIMSSIVIIAMGHSVNSTYPPTLTNYIVFVYYL